MNNNSIVFELCTTDRKSKKSKGQSSLLVLSILGGFLVVLAALPFFAHSEEDYQEDIEATDDGFLQKVKKLKVKKLEDLVYLSPFSDISVIQRRFMPKTGRVSAALSSVWVLTSEFFLHTGAEGHLTYHFLEKHALEFSGYYVFSFKRGVTSDLWKEMTIKASEMQSIVSSFVGLTYKWMPVYGKIAFNNRRILAFDTFFNIGAGMSGIKREIKGRSSSSPATRMVWGPTALVGLGQVFAITRDLGLRWDLRWHGTYELEQAVFLDSILFSIGLSYYYPSAGLR